MAVVMTAWSIRAEPIALKLVCDPDVREIAAGQFPDGILIEAQTNMHDLSYRWTYTGPGTLQGNPADSYILYRPEAVQHKQSEQAVITLTVSDGSGTVKTQHVSFKLLPAASPAPSTLATTRTTLPAAAPEPTTEKLTILSDPPIETIYMLGEKKNAEIILMAQTSKNNAEFEWTLNGPGALEGDTSSSIVLYILPESLPQRFDQAEIRVTVQNASGENAIANMIIKLMAPDDTVPALSPEVLEFRTQFDFVPVSAGTHDISKYLQQYLRFLVRKHVVIQHDFFIQAHEVTVGQFREYVRSLSWEEKKRIGTRWERGRTEKLYDDDRPVENVSWQDAAAYARWASEKTQWTLGLPTIEQWAAACVTYPGFAPVLSPSDGQPLSTIRHKVDHLLGNLREWSVTSCEDGGYFLLGENYMSDRNDPASIGRKQCASGSWNGIGFRLIRETR